MSCERNANKVGRIAGVAAGISAVASKFNHAAGAMLSKVSAASQPARQKVASAAAQLDSTFDRLGSKAAPAAGAVLRTVDGADRIASKVGGSRTAGLVAGYVLGRSTMRQARSIVRAVRRISGLAGSGVGRVSRRDQVGSVVREKRVLLFFKSKKAVTLWKSSLTNTLNKLDLLGSPRLNKSVRSSDGILFQTGGVTWHRGTYTVDAPGGERTITHLQSLAVPAAHYYFDRSITDEQAVGIATGQKGYNPRKIPGYVGQISANESLCPGWAGTKRAMITSNLYWGKRSGEDKPQ